ncbi:MAG TPA: tyrosine-type recombinase/integrase [Gammaproteobacteria bacterium]
MPRTTKLTKGRIQRLTYDPNGPSKQIAGDGQLPGFGVRVYRTGRKSYVLRYGPRGKERLMVLGPATTGEDVDAMREHAQALLRKMRTEGADPLTEKRKADSGTVAAIVTEYINAKGGDWSEKEVKHAKRRRDVNMRPIATTRLENLRRRDVRKMHQAIAAKYEANRTLALLRAAINHALSDGGWRASELAEGENPATRIEMHPEKHRREWIRPDELPRLLEAIDAEDDPWMRAFFRMLLYTGARKSELANLEWSNVDLKGGTITFRDTKNDEDHVVPLPPEAVKLLKATPRTIGNPYVFCGHVKGRPIVNPYKPWKRILARAGIERRITIHDVRRTVGSLLATQGYSTQQIGKLLNHKSAITAKVYAEIADRAKRDMVDAMARLLG